MLYDVHSEVQSLKRMRDAGDEIKVLGASTHTTAASVKRVKMNAKKPVMLVREGLMFEDHPRLNINRRPKTEYPEERWDEPLKVRMYTNGCDHRIVEITKDWGVDFYVYARTSPPVMWPNARNFWFIVYDARNGKMVYNEKEESTNVEELKHKIIKKMLEL